MEHLVIISPKGGAFAMDLSRYPHVYKLTAQSAQFAYFTYVGAISAKSKVLQILSMHNFRDFSLDKETNYYRLKVHVE